jgi:type II secretory pathway component PulF
MLQTGTPLNLSLAAIKAQIKAPFLRSVVDDLITYIEEGKSLSSALTKHEKEFSPATVSMVKAGETGGSLDEMLNQAGNLEKKKEEFRSMVQRAMTYPLFLVVLCFGVIVFVLTFVFPKFAALFADIWDVLPASTKILMAISRLVLDYWYAILIGLPALVLLFLNILQHQKVRPHIDRLKIVVPIVGRLYIMAYTSQMLRTLGFLLAGGVPLLEALTITRDASRNILYQAFIEDVIDGAKEGKGISYTFSQTEFLPETVKQVIKTGEDSGKMDFVMVRLAEYYDDEMEKQFKLLSTIIEPLALLMMGAVVGLIVMAIVFPIFKLSRAVQ